jgi:hypothetical protein
MHCGSHQQTLGGSRQGGHLNGHRTTANVAYTANIFGQKVHMDPFRYIRKINYILKI